LVQKFSEVEEEIINFDYSCRKLSQPSF